MNRKSNLPREYLEKGGPGRPKGVPNKVTRCMKVQTWKVFEALEANPKTSLEEIAKKNPTWFYTVFSSKMIPKDVNVRVIEKLEDLTEDEVQSLLEDLRERVGGSEVVEK